MSAEGRVEHQKLNQTAALLSFGLVFGVQLDYSCWLKDVSATAEKRVLTSKSCLFVIINDPLNYISSVYVRTVELGFWLKLQVRNYRGTSNRSKTQTPEYRQGSVDITQSVP